VTWRRLEDRTKGVYYTGEPQDNLSQIIDNTSSSEIQDAVNRALSSPLTLVAQGGEVNRLRSYDNISKLFQ